MVRTFVTAQTENLAEEFTSLRAAFGSLEVQQNESLSRHTRFAIGGPADLLITCQDAESFIAALAVVRRAEAPWTVIGGGTNLIVSDAGFRGVVLRLASRSSGPSVLPNGQVTVPAGVVLQSLVDTTISCGLRGLETMTGIPGWVGAAVYGNAGAYGRSICESVQSVFFFDGCETRSLDNTGCEFSYRESIFKRNKHWLILGCSLTLEPDDSNALQAKAGGILRIRNEKYPPTMKCAGSIFKNLLFDNLPADVQARIPASAVREGKVPSAWFLEQAGAKGLRVGDIQVATYHANLIYNDGAGTARDLVHVIAVLKQRVGDFFGIQLGEEVQYVGSFQEA